MLCFDYPSRVYYSWKNESKYLLTSHWTDNVYSIIFSQVRISALLYSFNYPTTLMIKKGAQFGQNKKGQKMLCCGQLKEAFKLESKPLNCLQLLLTVLTVVWQSNSFTHSELKSNSFTTAWYFNVHPGKLASADCWVGSIWYCVASVEWSPCFARTWSHMDACPYGGDDFGNAPWRLWYFLTRSHILTLAYILYTALWFVLWFSWTRYSSCFLGW